VRDEKKRPEAKKFASHIKRADPVWMGSNADVVIYDQLKSIKVKHGTSNSTYHMSPTAIESILVSLPRS
jgi:hypothetical protein